MERIVSSPRTFLEKGRLSLIAECKKGSPSKGLIADQYDSVKISLAYERGGANAISVLTEEDYFFGSISDLVQVRQNVSIPVLRKDFIFDEYQIIESWALGADAVLLIVAALDEILMKDLYLAARAYDLSVLVESHDEKEIEKALKLEEAVIGINSRNLKNFSVDLNRISAMRSLIPHGRIAVAESGILSVDDGVNLARGGFDAFLIGEYFMRADDPASKIKEFLQAVRL
jgi:indole-3-glycerol phosphate synthase